jgi:hypothetical protein
LSIAEYIAPAWRERLAAAGLTRPADLLDRSPAELALGGRWECLAKPGLGRRERWRWELPGSEEPDTLYLKRYGEADWKSIWDRAWRQSVRHGRAWWECDQARLLAAAQIRAPQAIASAEHMRGVAECGSVVLLSAAEGDAFDRLWPRAVRGQAPITRGRSRHAVTTGLARFVWRFHATGLCHRDLYLCHIFTNLDLGASAAPQFTLIDLARTFRPRWRRLRWIIKDLSQLDASARQIGASRTDRLRFLRAYLALSRAAPRIRFYARRIVRKSDWILARIARKSHRQ